MESSLAAFLVTVVIGSFLAGRTASSRNRSVLGWAVFGSLVPAIALALLFWLPPRAAGWGELDVHKSVW